MTKKKVVPTEQCKADPFYPEIIYRKAADKTITIVGFTGILSEVEISERYGAEVARLYRKKPEVAYRSVMVHTGEVCITVGREMESNKLLSPLFIGQKFRPKDFKSEVENLLQAGRNLAETIREVRAAEKAPLGRIKI